MRVETDDESCDPKWTDSSGLCVFLTTMKMNKVTLNSFDETPIPVEWWQYA